MKISTDWRDYFWCGMSQGVTAFITSHSDELMTEMRHMMTWENRILWSHVYWTTHSHDY